MYVPRSFARDDAATLRDLMRARPFATLVTMRDGAPYATHVPLLHVDDGSPHGVLLGHVARANPQWKSLSGEALAIFHGPHAYISPTWYEAPEHVPTWNYAVVHAYGALRVLDGDAAERVLGALVAAMEPTSWRLEELPAAKRAALIAAIVAFELPIARVEGKWKVGQNRTAAERTSAAAHLRAQGGEDAEAVAGLMLDTLSRAP